jgi:membrane-bound acyltransferase YfiQ involved in biofilm formation
LDIVDKKRNQNCIPLHRIFAQCFIQILTVLSIETNRTNALNTEKFYWTTGAIGWFISTPVAKLFADNTERFLKIPQLNVRWLFARSCVSVFLFVVLSRP